jgi:hypothetical protein
MTILKEHFDIAICIPSKDEGHTISNVVRIVDAGLREHYPQKKSIIINIDSYSSDDTCDHFLSTPSVTPKISIKESRDSRLGKGINLHKFFSLAEEMTIECGAVIDGDLESIDPKWIFQLLQPVLADGIDFVTPLYSRHKYDATITNQLCFPLLYGKWGVAVRQPIGGEFAFSQRYITSALHELNHLNNASDVVMPFVDAFGIDIFLTTHALKNQFSVHQSYLGQKLHRFREISTLKNMFTDVAAALFTQLSKEHKGDLPKSYPLDMLEATPAFETDIVIDGEASKAHLIAEHAKLKDATLKIYQVLAKIATPESDPNNGSALLSINSDEWVNILAYYLRNPVSPENLRDTLAALYPLFIARLNDQFKQVANLNYQESEKIFLAQAAHLKERL